MIRFFTLLMAILTIGYSTNIHAQSITINANKDNTLYESTTGNISNGIGDHLFVGRTNQTAALDARRALIQFDIAANVPANATIVSCTLTMTMNKSRGNTQTVSLNAVTSDWGEGTSNAPGQEGSGTTATTGDATWVNNFFGSSSWLAPGGDFNVVSSASTSVGGTGTYTWTSATMATEVQNWLTTPATNRGWILTGNESSPQSAQRFASRENATGAPQLTIVYTTPTPATITSQPSDDVSCENGFAQFAITATNATSYQWQEFTGSWANVINGGVYSGATTNTLDLAGIGTGLSGNQYRCIAININGNDTSNAATLTVNPLPNVTINPGNTDICDGDTITLNGTTIFGGFYQWYLDGVAISGATSNTLDATAAGSYNQMVTDGLGCSDTAATATVITVNNLPGVSISPGDTSLCNSDTIILTGASGGTLQWFKDGSPLAGETSSTLAVSDNTTGPGSFNQMKTNTNGCSAMATTPTVVSFQLCSGVEELENNLALQLFPNPVTNNLNIQLEQPISAQLAVIDLQGRTLQQIQLQDQAQIQLSVADLPNGLYLLRLQNEEINATYKITVLK